jgi:hypothetical protein
VWMPNGALEQAGPLVELANCGAGDVLAARTCADALLESQSFSDPVYRDARLIMTAVCLQLQSRSRRSPTLPALAALLSDLETEKAGSSRLRNSPMQFLQFAAAEIDSLEPEIRRRALELCLSACGTALPQNNNNTFARGKKV